MRLHCNVTVFNQECEGKTKPCNMELCTQEAGSRERGLLPARPLRQPSVVLTKDQRTRQRTDDDYGGPEGWICKLN